MQIRSSSDFIMSKNLEASYLQYKSALLSDIWGGQVARNKSEDGAGRGKRSGVRNTREEGAGSGRRSGVRNTREDGAGSGMRSGV